MKTNKEYNEYRKELIKIIGLGMSDSWEDIIDYTKILVDESSCDEIRLTTAEEIVEAKEEQVIFLKECLEYFIRRVKMGSIHSKTTRSKFERALEEVGKINLFNAKDIKQARNKETYRRFNNMSKAEKEFFETYNISKVCTSVEKCFNTPPCHPCESYNYPILTDDIMHELKDRIHLSNETSNCVVLRAYTASVGLHKIFVSSIFN